MHIALQSRNGKTGPMPATTAPISNCPDSCPLLKKACYGKGGHLAIHWRRVSAKWAACSRAERAELWRQHLATIRSLPHDLMWRCHQAGDFWGTGARINKTRLLELARANMRRRALAYSHYLPIGPNLEAFRAAAELGFHVNLSANSPAEADRYAETGLPVVTILPLDVIGRATKTPAGRTITICPASHRKDITCGGGLVGDRWTKRCGICANPRHNVVGFPAHGSARRMASAIAETTA